MNTNIFDFYSHGYTKPPISIPSIWEGYWDAYDVSRQSVRSLTTYHILLAEFEEVPMKWYALKLTICFQQWLAHPTLLWVSWSINLVFLTPCQTRVWHLAQIDNLVECITTFVSTRNIWQPNIINNHIWWSQEAFMVEEWKSFCLSRKKLITFTSTIFSKWRCIVLEATIWHSIQDQCCFLHLAP